MSRLPEILVATGPLSGQRFTVSVGGLRLGRSSSCEIAISDPALSRNHCLFEIREDSLWVTDLASANGTFVGNEQLGAESRQLLVGDTVVAGESRLVIVGNVEENVSSVQVEEVDLGLGRTGEPFTGNYVEPGGQDSSMRRFIWWIAALFAVIGAAFMILSDVRSDAEVSAKTISGDEEAPVLRAFSYEKVEADSEGIYRSMLSLDANGELTVEIDDVPKENRHVRKTQKLSDAAMKELSDILSNEALYKLDREYVGVPIREGSLMSRTLRVVRGSKIFRTMIENAQEPDAFNGVRERLETFSKNELGIWAIQYSREKLLEMSEEARRTGDAKWQEREVQYGNIAAAHAAYREAVFYLETVNPKPAHYGELVAQRDKVAAELDKRYRDQRFLADRAINLGDWSVAQRELRVLCELVPDAKDERHVEAAAKLVDVENRIKKGNKQ